VTEQLMNQNIQTSLEPTVSLSNSEMLYDKALYKLAFTLLTLLNFITMFELSAFYFHARIPDNRQLAQWHHHLKL